MKRIAQLSLCAVVLCFVAACGSSGPGKLSPKARMEYTPDEEMIRSDVSQGFERPPTFQAKSLLPKEMLKSKIHVVDNKVMNDGYMNFFTVKSEYGNFQAVGKEGVALRIREIDAIRQLKMQSTRLAVQDSAAKTGASIIEAPFRVAGKVLDYTLNPSKAFESSSDSVYGSAAKTVDTDASGTYDAGASLEAEDKPGFLARQFDMNEDKREWYRKLELDPYSHNEVLRGEIDRLSRAKSAGKIGFKFVPIARGLTLIAEINKYMGYATSVSKYDDPKRLQKQAARILSSMSIPQNEITAFMNNEALIPPIQASVAVSLQSMEGVKNRAGIVEMVAAAENRRQAHVLSRAVLELAEYHTGVQPLDQIVEEVRIPAAVTANGHLMVPLPVDHLVWTKNNAVLFTGVRERVTKEHHVTTAEVRVRGSISSKALQSFKDLGANRVKYLRVIG